MDFVLVGLIAIGIIAVVTLWIRLPRTLTVLVVFVCAWFLEVNAWFSLLGIILLVLGLVLDIIGLQQYQPDPS